MEIILPGNYLKIFRTIIESSVIVSLWPLVIWIITEAMSALSVFV